MGKITIFKRSDCRHCVSANRILTRAIQEISSQTDSRIEILEIDVSSNASNAALCIRLSGKRTVPQIFFNEKLIGNASQLDEMDKSGELEQELLNLAHSPSPNFPPETEAAMVKVTEEVAFSSQPTLSQIKALYKFGFRTLINVVSEDISMSSPETRIGIELEEERSYAEQQGLYYIHYPVPVRIGQLRKAHAAIIIPLVFAIKRASEIGSQALVESNETSDCESDGEKKMECNASACVTEITRDTKTCENKSCLAENEFVSNTDEIRSSITDRTCCGVEKNIQKTCECISTALSEAEEVCVGARDKLAIAMPLLFNMRSPILIHCRTGRRSCIITLCVAALQLNVRNSSQIIEWGRDLGHDLSQPGTVACIQEVLDLSYACMSST